jgi:DNA-binding XRE family transcriptional regulator
MPSPGGTIYAIGAVGTSWVKIGCTTGPVMKRLQTLQTGQPFPLQVLASIPVETDAHRIERQVHAFLVQDKRRGEWFEVPMDLATLEALIVRAVQFVAAQEERKRLRQQEQETARCTATMDINELIGERISQARTRRGWNQSELARRLGKPRQHLSQIEQGKQQPRAELLIELATVLGVSTDYLLGRAYDERQPADQAALTPQPTRRQRPRKAAPVG